jgi:glycerol-3-phosphate dehydrogenase
MSTGSAPEVEVAVVGAGVVGCAVTLALARRDVTVALVEAEPEPALAASATNSGILHTGFDSKPGELETELILRSAALRSSVLKALDVPVLHCGAVICADSPAGEEAIARLASNAARNGVEVALQDDLLSIPGEAVTDPVAFTLALASAAQRRGAALKTNWRLAAIERAANKLTLEAAGGERLSVRVVVNCAGLCADAVARLVGDDSFAIYPRKGEFLVFEPPEGRPLEHILLPIPSEGTKGVLVFPTIDGMVVAGPTAVDQTDKDDWTVRPEAGAEILPKAAAMYPPLADTAPAFAYAGLRPAGRGVNYVIERSRSCERLVNVAAIRSTGLSASLGIAERVAEMVASLGIRLGPERELEPNTITPPPGPWWRRTAEHRMKATA